MLHVEIRIRGRIAEHWSSWFEDLTVEYTDDETRLSGHVADQAALYGLLSRLRDLGLPLLSVETLEEKAS
ncbi:MAG: hypothetical protein JXA93_12255 [Anaerolineae bacterium]|nr:hypothetical protein [Anaerolineae bacterium]